MARSLPKLKNHPCTVICYVCILISFIELIINPRVAALSFNFTSFGPNGDGDIVYNGSATSSASGAIELTSNQRDANATSSTGAATYKTHLQLWDKASGRLTDFITNFSFVIKPVDVIDTNYGDGLAFFLAPVGSGIPLEAGGGLGLTYKNQTTVNSTDHKFVAVEFDIYKNDWDPPENHVGIDINSMVSVENTTWSTRDSIKKNRTHDAQITYDSVSTSLGVDFSGFDVFGTPFRKNLSYKVNLTEHLPERVTFGFTASTGDSSALHSILSWSFSSTLQIDTNMPSPPPKSKSKIGLVIGLIVAGSVLVSGSGILLSAFWKRRGRRDYEHDAAFEIPEFESGTGPKKFKYTDLARATSNFAEHEKLGEGGFGGVYKGYLSELNTYVDMNHANHVTKPVTKYGKHNPKIFQV